MCVCGTVAVFSRAFVLAMRRQIACKCLRLSGRPHSTPLPNCSPGTSQQRRNIRIIANMDTGENRHQPRLPHSHPALKLDRRFCTGLNCGSSAHATGCQCDSANAPAHPAGTTIGLLLLGEPTAAAAVVAATEAAKVDFNWLECGGWGWGCSESQQ